MRDRNLVARQESSVAVALRTRIGEVFASNSGVRFTGSLHFMDGAVARHALRRIMIALRRGLAMDAGRKIFYLIGVTLFALCRRKIFRGSQFVHVAMASGASGTTKDRVGARGETFGFLLMTGAALHSGDFGGMRKILDGRVAILAAENSVRAGRVLCRIDGNVFAAIRLHARCAMARQAWFILFKGMGILWCCDSESGSEHRRQGDQQGAKVEFAALPMRSYGAHKALPPDP